MKLLRVFSQRLYLRIWLAVVVGVAALTMCVAWAWKIAEEQRAQNNATPPSREMILRGPKGDVIFEGRGNRVLPRPHRQALRSSQSHTRFPS